jgi:hypothetical protein
LKEDRSMRDRNKRFKMYQYSSKMLNYFYRKKLPQCIEKHIKETFPEGDKVGYQAI